jgi:hypothetical protein
MSRFSDGRASSFPYVPLAWIGMEFAYMGEVSFIAKFIVVNNSKYTFR